MDLACLKIDHPAPLPGEEWKGKSRTVTVDWAAELSTPTSTQTMNYM